MIAFQEGLSDIDSVLEPTREKPTIIREQLVEAEDEQVNLELVYFFLFHCTTSQVFLQRLAAAESAAPAAQKKSSLLDDAADNKTPLSSFFSNLLKVSCSLYLSSC